MAEFSFLEFSYDPSVTATEDITDYLTKLGFIHRSQHKSEIVGFWNLKSCILLLRKTHDFNAGSISSTLLVIYLCATMSMELKPTY